MDLVRPGSPSQSLAEHDILGVGIQEPLVSAEHPEVLPLVSMHRAASRGFSDVPKISLEGPVITLCVWERWMLSVSHRKILVTCRKVSTGSELIVEDTTCPSHHPYSLLPVS